MSKIDYTLWPNTDGNLGNIKVQIPDGNTINWPSGDALVGNFVYSEGELVAFIDDKALIANNSKTTTFPYEYVNISLPSIAEGEMSYNYDQCTYVVLNGTVLKGDISSDDDLEEINFKYTGCKTVADIKAVDPDYLTNDIIDGVWSEGLADLEQGNSNGKYYGGMFYNCTALNTFNSDLSGLTDGRYMFCDCDNLTSFTSDLPNLTNGGCMFQWCNNLTSFSSTLPSLTDGGGMFISCNLSSWNINLPSLTNGQSMFSDCKNLTSFSIDLPSLTDGNSMFDGCSNLTSFTSELPNLMYGNWMFEGCTNLSSFTSELPNLTDSSGMFYNCANLTSFNSNLSSLENGGSMFYQCSNLTSFTSGLPSLRHGN